MKPPTALEQALADALAHHRAGRVARAEALYRRILVQEACDRNAWHLLGVLQEERGDHKTGERCVRRALLIAEAPEFHLNLGLLLSVQGRQAEAAEAFKAALRLRPDEVEAHVQLGNALRLLRRPNEAAAAYRQALALHPGLVEAHTNLGVLMLDVGEMDLAIAAFCAAIQHKPDHVEAHINLGNAHRLQGRLGEAAACYSIALHFRPDMPEAWCNLGNVRKEQGQLHHAVAAQNQALQLRPGYAAAHSDLLMTQHYMPECGNADFLAAARGWSARHAASPEGSGAAAPFAKPRSPDRPLRVGYVSGDFNSHPVGYFLENVLSAHAPAAVSAVCYANNGRSDRLTDRLRAAATGWRDIVGVGDEAVAAMIRQDGIDLLVDLSGHTAENRLSVFVRRPAPVQASWLGYFGTTGLPAMDWIIADRHVVPPGEERFFTESVWRLPHSYLCFTPPPEEVPVAPPPFLATGSLTLGSVSTCAKITPQTVALWAHVLAALPQTRLLLKAVQLGDAGLRQALRDQFAAHGIAGNRLKLEGKSPRDEYLAGFGRIDLALEPTPFGGGTTTAEGLWMGVPALGLRGDRWAGRIGESFLHTLGLADRLVADGPDDLVAKIAALAADPDGLADLRAGLRKQLLTSPLCDAPAFARDLEAAYRAMWRRWCEAG